MSLRGAKLNYLRNGCNLSSPIWRTVDWRSYVALTRALIHVSISFVQAGTAQGGQDLEQQLQQKLLVKQQQVRQILWPLMFRHALAKQQCKRFPCCSYALCCVSSDKKACRVCGCQHVTLLHSSHAAKRLVMEVDNLRWHFLICGR